MNPVGAAETTRPVVSLGLTEGLASALAQRFALHRPPARFDADAPVIVVQNARVDGPEMNRQPGLKLIAAFGVGVDRVDLVAAKERGIVVNIARGSIIDEEALIEALEKRMIAGAGLDVFTQEPNVPPRLFALDNVVLAPHIAGSTHETWEEAGALLMQNLDHFFSTGRPLTPVAR